jgi:hypothetical protein
MCKKLLCKYQDETEWEEYIVDYTDKIDIDRPSDSQGWVNYMIPVRPYMRWGEKFYRCSCYCSEEDKSFPTIKYDGKKYNLWKRASARKFIAKFNRDAELLAEMSRIEDAIDMLE